MHGSWIFCWILTCRNRMESKAFMQKGIFFRWVRRKNKSPNYRQLLIFFLEGSDIEGLNKKEDWSGIISKFINDFGKLTKYKSKYWVGGKITEVTVIINLLYWEVAIKIILLDEKLVQIIEKCQKTIATYSKWLH